MNPKQRRLGARHNLVVLGDLLSPGLAVVFCGTAAGNLSWETRSYYANPGNRFWKTLHSVGLTDRLLAPEEFGSLRKWGIGLTDLCKASHGADSTLSAKDYDLPGFWRRIADHQPRHVAFNGKQAARQALNLKDLVPGLQPSKQQGAHIWVLPSTSGLASKHWDEGPWRELAAAVRLADRWCAP